MHVVKLRGGGILKLREPVIPDSIPGGSVLNERYVVLFQCFPHSIQNIRLSALRDSAVNCNLDSVRNMFFLIRLYHNAFNVFRLPCINIPNSTKRIGAHAFEGCTELSSVVFGSAGRIEEYAFAGCSPLAHVGIPSGTSIIGAHAFENCTGMTSMIILDAPIIDEYAFAGCTGITYVSFPTEMKEIRAHAFDGCTELKSIHLWNDDTQVDDLAFANCTNLK